MSTLLEEPAYQTLREALFSTIEEAQIKAMRSKHHHAISLIEKAREPHYNCVQFAFDLVDLPDDIRNAVDEIERWQRQRHLWCTDPFGTMFVNFLIEQRALHNLNSDEHKGVIVYLDGERVRHAGKIQGHLIRSKWNHLGHFWQHGIWEVPIDYGNRVQLFKSIAKNELLQRWSDFEGEVRNADTRRKQQRLEKSLHHPTIL